MDLHSGYPFWLVRNGLLADFPELDRDLPNEEVVIIGSGISGAMAAYTLCKAGFRCTMIDKRLVSAGSTWASTAQLNYEIDASMVQLSQQYGEAFAVEVYQASLKSVHRVQEMAEALKLGSDTEPRSSIYLASNKKGEQEIKEECSMRRKHGFPVELLQEDDLRSYRIMNHNHALYHQHAFEFDAYRLTVGLINHSLERGNFTVYTRTCVAQMKSEKGGVVLKTSNGKIIKARYVVCAPGYESQQFLPRKVMNLHSTFALVTQPLPEEAFWKERCLIWESKRPYFYCRTTMDNRIMMGGEDVSFVNERKRDLLMQKKKKALLEHCRSIFPHLNIQADFVWCGTFGESDDGLPFIGKYPGMDHVYFALGYGGNGTTYSAIAAEVICNQLRGIPDNLTRLFGFDRKPVR